MSEPHNRLTLLTETGCTAEYDDGLACVLANTVFFEWWGERYTLWLLSVGRHCKRVKSDPDGGGLVK